MNKELEKMFLKAYESNSDAIFRFIFFKINDREKALDMLQETFMKTWIYISKNDNIKNLKAFLYKVASNGVIDEYRKRGSTPSNESIESLAEDGFELSENSDSMEKAIDRLDGEKVIKIAKTLPEPYMSVIIMKYMEDLSIKEISENLEITENLVSVRLNRGLKKLKDRLSAEESRNMI